MKEPLRIENRPWTRVEGIFNSNYNINNIPAKENFKTVLYTGNIDERYGIITLIEAFRLINDENYRLWIRGNGSTMKYIIEAEKKDSRITYFNEMSRPELMILQKKATVLINPVSSTELFTRYFFPSKTMDYMASGTPTIMTKLKSIPTEYLDYVYLAENDDSEGLKKIIVEVCSKNQSELDEFGKKASQFIMKEKNAYKQVRKIYDMISKL